MIRALILDLDNTIYAAGSIGHLVFKEISDLLEKHRHRIGPENLPAIKSDLTKKAFQKIAEEYGFGEELTAQGMAILRHKTYDYPIHAFSDYTLVKQLKLDKFLVTTGFTKLQQSKARMLDLESDFIEIIINDPEKTSQTKKDVFAHLLQKHHYQPAEALVIGDDPESEIKAGRELGMPTLLYDPHGEYGDEVADHHINNYAQLAGILASYKN